MVTDTQTFEKIIQSPEKKTNGDAEQLFDVFGVSHTTPRLKKKKNDEKPMAVPMLDTLTRIQQKAEEAASKNYDSNYPQVYGLQRAWYLGFLNEANGNAVTEKLTVCEEVTIIIEHQRQFIKITKFDRLLMKKSASIEGLKKLYPKNVRPENNQFQNWDFLEVPYTILPQDITSVSTNDQCKQAVNILVIRFYVLMFYCASRKHVNDSKSTNVLRQNLFIQVVMDLVSIYNDLLHIDLKKKWTCII